MYERGRNVRLSVYAQHLRSFAYFCWILSIFKVKWIDKVGKIMQCGSTQLTWDRKQSFFAWDMFLIVLFHIIVNGKKLFSCSVVMLSGWNANHRSFHWKLGRRYSSLLLWNAIVSFINLKIVELFSWVWICTHKYFVTTMARNITRAGDVINIVNTLTVSIQYRVIIREYKI